MFFEMAIIIIKVFWGLYIFIACATEKVTEQKKEERNWNYLPFSQTRHIIKSGCHIRGLPL